jgi:hypothetical protein
MLLKLWQCCNRKYIVIPISNICYVLLGREAAAKLFKSSLSVAELKLLDRLLSRDSVEDISNPITIGNR